ncbi:MAG: hypothetical protein ABI294_03715 [Casimicrobiaceae bacterium]
MASAAETHGVARALPAAGYAGCLQTPFEVLGIRGDLGGFMHSTASDPLRIKRRLLAHERKFFDGPLR